MSAFQVTNDHIIALAINSNSDRDVKEINRRAEVLFNANAESLKARYGDKMPIEGSAPMIKSLMDVSKWIRLNAVAILKLSGCYSYQSCKFAGWNESEAHKIIEEAKARAIRALPGYEDAPYTI